MALARNDTAEEYISTLIHNRQENEFVDFKQFYYHEDKKYDLIKDIVAFSNDSNTIDKYIIFGVVNDTWDVYGIDPTTIPDVSELNDLLHMYVEPFIYIEVGKFQYKEKNLGYIKIPANRADRPYVIKKEYSKSGRTHLRCGEIYVRKNANNFIATRRDLDHIYDNNGAFIISVFDQTVEVGAVLIRNEHRLFVQIRTVLSNKMNRAINISRATCDISSSRNTTQYECDYCSDKTRVFSHVPSTIYSVPVSLLPGMELQKSLYFSISSESAGLLLRKHREGERFFVKLDLFDVSGNKYISQPYEIALSFYGGSNIL